MVVSDDGLTVAHKGGGLWDIAWISAPMPPNTGVHRVVVHLLIGGQRGRDWGDRAMIGVATDEFEWAARNAMFGPRGYPNSSPLGTFIHSNAGGGSQFGSLGSPSSTFPFASGPVSMKMNTDEGVLTIYQT